MKKILVTGGAGFIGSCLIKTWLRDDADVFITNLDKLTYSGDVSRLAELKKNPRYFFIKGDICDPAAVRKAMKSCEAVVHLAAESHVDRSLLDAKDFFDSNVYGTYVLLEEARRIGVKRFILVSTDEVYGSRTGGGSFKEKDILNPSSPYSVSKASADLLALSYVGTHHLPVLVTRGANTYGSYQYPEKVIPLFVTNALSDQPLPVYGDGRQIRNWLFVEDHCLGIMKVFHKGKVGEIYNISSKTELENLDLTRQLLKILGKPETLIKHVTDRLGHDRRYAIDSSKLRALGWKERFSFKDAFRETVLWYVQNESWWKRIKEKQADFKKYYLKAYGGLSKKSG